MMKTFIGRDQFEVKQTGNRYFYWSTNACRWLPVKKAKVIFPPDLSKVTDAMMHEASTITDVDQALRILQKAAGITTGDAAGIFFSGCDARKVWPVLSVSSRLAWLREYVTFESHHAD